MNYSILNRINNTYGLTFRNIDEIPPFLTEYYNQFGCYVNTCKSMPITKVIPPSLPPSLPSSLPQTETPNYPFKTTNDLIYYVQQNKFDKDILGALDNDTSFENTYFGKNIITEIYKTDVELAKYDAQFKPEHNSIFKINGIKKLINDSLVVQDQKMFQCKKVFFDIVTEFVNNNKIFNDNKMKYIARYQYLINTLFNDVTTEYRNKYNISAHDLIFIYKGGTTMKILISEHLKSLQNAVPHLYDEIKDAYFGRSDSDYSFLINPYHPNFNKIYLDITKITTLLLLLIKKILAENLNFFCTFGDLVKDDYINLLESFNKKLDELRKGPIPENLICTDVLKIKRFIGIVGAGNSHVLLDQIPDNFLMDTMFQDKDDTTIVSPLKKKHVPFPRNESKRKNFYVTNNNTLSGDKYLYIAPINDNLYNEIFLSFNETTSFKNKDNKDVAFNLGRLKYNFIAYYETIDGKFGYFNCPSELVDISIVKHQSYDLKLTFEKDINANKIHVEKEIVKYKYNYNDGSDNIEIVYNGYSIYGFISDFVKVFFYHVSYPWKTPKYTKRVYRILTFMFLELYYINKLLIFNLISHMCDNMIINSTNLTKMNGVVVNDIDHILAEIEGTSTHKVMTLTKVLYQNLNFDDIPLKQNFIDYITLWKKISDVIITDTKNNTFSINPPRVFFEESGMHVVSQMGGKQKYLKYVSKNFNILRLLKEHI